MPDLLVEASSLEFLEPCAKSRQLIKRQLRDRFFDVLKSHRRAS